MTRASRRAQLDQAGNWLRTQRESRNFSQQQLADRAGLGGKSVISNYETGVSRVGDEAAEGIAEALGLPILEVRRQLGMWVPESDTGAAAVDVLAAIALDPNLNEEEKVHISFQYTLLVRSSNWSKHVATQRPRTDEEAKADATRLSEQMHRDAVTRQNRRQPEKTLGHTSETDRTG